MKDTNEYLLGLTFEELFNQFKYFVEAEANRYTRAYKYLNKEDLLSSGYEAIHTSKINYDESYGMKFRNYILENIRYAIKSTWSHTYRKLKYRDTEEDNIVQLYSYEYNDLEAHGGEYEFTDNIINQMILKNALETLTERQRYIVEASIVKGRTQGEIAKELGIKQSSVNDALKRALVKLRMELTGETEEVVKEKTKGNTIHKFPKGITQKKNNKYQVVIYHKGTNTYVGTYKTLKEAMINYNIKALEIIGSNAYQHSI